MSELFFRTPGFASGCPRGRLQAVCGISSPTQGTGASAQSAGITASSTGRYFFIEPAEAQSNGDNNSRSTSQGFLNCAEESHCCKVWGKILLSATLHRLLLRGTFLPVVVEADVVGRKIRQNEAPQFKHVHGAEILVENFAVGIDENGVGNRRLPGWIKRRLKGGRIILIEQQVSAGSMLFFKHSQDTGFFVRHICGDGDQLQVAILVHLEGVLKITELVDARTAPGGPKTDEQHVFRGILT